MYDKWYSINSFYIYIVTRCIYVNCTFFILFHIKEIILHWENQWIDITFNNIFFIKLLFIDACANISYCTNKFMDKIKTVSEELGKVQYRCEWRASKGVVLIKIILIINYTWIGIFDINYQGDFDESDKVSSAFQGPPGLDGMKVSNPRGDPFNHTLYLWFLDPRLLRSHYDFITFRHID